MRRISHRSVVAGGALSVGKLVTINTATHQYALSAPGNASWPRRGVVIDDPDDYGLQEVLISGSFTPSWNASPSEWVVVTAGGVLASSTDPGDHDDIVGYIDEYGLGQIGKLHVSREIVEEDQWERQTVAINPPLSTFLYWTVAPGTTNYHVLLQPVSVSPHVLVNGSPSYQTESTLVPYYPVKFVTATDSIQLINANAAHSGISVVYDAQLVR